MYIYIYTYTQYIEYANIIRESEYEDLDIKVPIVDKNNT